MKPSGSKPGRVAQSVGHLTRKSEVLGSILGLATFTFVSPFADSRGAVVSNWRKYVHEILVNRLGSLSLPRKRVVRLTDRPDKTVDVYRRRKTTTQQQHEWLDVNVTIEDHEFELSILCPPHRTHVSIMLAQGQGHSLHLGFHPKPVRIFNITLLTY